MAKFLKAGAQVGALWLAISLVVWLITIWRWQSTGYAATTGDIVGQLFVLPLLLSFVFVLALWGIDRLRVQAAAPLTPSPAKAAQLVTSGVPATQADAGSDDARALSAWVLAEAMTLAAGSDATSAWNSLQARAMRPTLDRELQDVDGMPVFTARVPELDLADWLDAHAELTVSQQPALPEPVLRGLALLEGPLHQMLSAIAGLVADPADDIEASGALGASDAERAQRVPEPSMKAHLSGVAVPVPQAASLAQAASAPQLTVRVLLPAHWAKPDRDATVDWLRSQCGSLLDWADAVRAHGVRWLTEPLAQPESLWDELDQCMVGWSRQVRPELWLVLAVDSAINADTVGRMQAVGELFTATHQTGKVPGEGAVALLLASAQWPGLGRLEAAPIQVWRPVRTRRDKSADAAGRVGTQALRQAIGHAVSQCRATKDSLLVVADADHRASRTAELFESLQDVVPGLDPMLAVTRVGEACGELGMARALAPSALACTALRAAGEPGQVAVAAHVQSSHDRVVVALAPWVPAAAAA
jgi:hypothetical protein